MKHFAARYLGASMPSATGRTGILVIHPDGDAWFISEESHSMMTWFFSRGTFEKDFDDLELEKKKTVPPGQSSLSAMLGGELRTLNVEFK